MNRPRPQSRHPGRRLPRSPSSSPSRSRPRTYSESYTRSSDSRTRSRSRSRSRSSPHRRGRPSHEEKKENLIKGSAGLLLGIGVAAVVAHKFWPKGVLHGAKEDWETKIKPAITGERDDEDGCGRRSRDRRRDDEGGDDRRARRVRSRGGRVYCEEDIVMSGGAGDRPPLRRTRSARASTGVEQQRRRRGDDDFRQAREQRSEQRNEERTRKRMAENVYVEEKYYRRDGTFADPDEAIYVVERTPLRPLRRDGHAPSP